MSVPGSEAPAPVPERHAEAAAPSAEESSFALLARARQGDRVAMDILFARYLEPLRRWASGRLPRWARDMADTHDLVQETLLQTFKNIGLRRRGGEYAFEIYPVDSTMPGKGLTPS